MLDATIAIRRLRGAPARAQRLATGRHASRVTRHAHPDRQRIAIASVSIVRLALAL
jgi:hypothetical protein